MKTVVRIYKNYDEMSECAAQKIFHLAQFYKKLKGNFTIAISGGNTPQRMFERLALLKRFPWPNTHFFWADERWVSRRSARSNFKLFRDRLFKAEVNKIHAHPAFHPHTSAKKGARLYEEHIGQFFKISKNKFPKFDLIILGVGEDGHVASLFPKRRELLITNKLVIPIPRFQKMREERVSLSLSVINNAHNVLLLVAGKNKAGVVKQLLNKRKSKSAMVLPAARVKPRHGNLMWFLDKGAAAYVE